MYGYADGGSPGTIGYSTSGDGVYGIGAASGILGATSSESAAAVSGQNFGGDGVDGFGGTYGNGVYGTTSGSGEGVFGEASRVGGLFESTGSGGVALAAVAQNANNDVLDANNYAAKGAFRVDPYGNGYFTGSVYTLQTPMIDQVAKDGSRAGTFSAQSTRATLEETGTAHLARGEAAVRFDPSYAKLLDFRRGYQVFLTPDGDTRGLYIAGKYEGGFIVREIEPGRSSLDFDYRVVGNPYGTNDARLPEIEFHWSHLSGIATEPKRPARPSLPAVKP